MVWEGNEVAGINLEGPPITVDVCFPTALKTILYSYSY